jgi:hypothetical protein
MGDEKEKQINREGLTYHVTINKVHDVYGRNLLTSLEWMGVPFPMVGTIKSVSPRHNGLCISLNHWRVWRKSYQGKCMEGISRNGANGVNHANEQRGMLLSSQPSAICHLRILCAIVGRRSDVKGASFFLRNYRVSEFQVPAKICLVEGLSKVGYSGDQPSATPHTGTLAAGHATRQVVLPGFSCCFLLPIPGSRRE